LLTPDARTYPFVVAAVANTPLMLRNPFFFKLCKSLLILFSLRALHAEAAESAISLINLSLEELGKIQIISVSKRSENLATAPASVFVITSGDIRRSGATTLPEILRLAPNLQVARLDNAQYAITARGFNNAIGNKLLVLLDGRTIYTPLFSGVFWEMQDTLIEDIERIEVISGPGGTLWGANAVNGVINIITRSAFDTKGTFLAGDHAHNEQGLTLRSGFTAGSRTAVRLYGKLRDWDNTHLASGGAVNDSWSREQIGFRSDWQGSNRNLTLIGNVYQGNSEHRGFFGAIGIPAIKVSGMDLLARWGQKLANGSDVQFQGYWSKSKRQEFVIFSPDSDILDLEFQQTIAMNSHQIVWGAAYRHAEDKVGDGFFTTFKPNARTLDWQSVFAQDEIQLNRSLRAIVGVKLEWNDFTGMEYLPSARLAWEVSDNNMLWTSLSRAVRAPSRFDRDVFFPKNPPFIIAGGPNFESEVAKVFELGYRTQLSDIVNFSLTAFQHDWDKLRSGTAPPFPTYLANNIEGEAYGMEAWVTWQVLTGWRMSGGMTTLEKDLEFKAGTSDTAGINNATLHNDPDYQWMLRSGFDLPANLTFDIHLRGIDELSIEPVPSYTELNVRLAWVPISNMEIAVTGRNLLHKTHPEFGAIANRSELERSALLSIRWLH
jgi:iron complex outermembrane recepter protein